MLGTIRTRQLIYLMLGAARDSLYVKFDPLVGGRPSILGRPSVAPFARRPEPEDLIAINTPVTGPLRSGQPPPSQSHHSRHDIKYFFNGTIPLNLHVKIIK